MKKIILIVAVLLFCSITMVWLPCEAQDALYGCAKTNKGTFRLVSNPNQCLKSEYPVTLSGSTLPQNPVPNFNGEICWSLEITEKTQGATHEGPFVLRAFVQYLGSTYLIQGTIPIPGEPVISNGSAVVVDDDIFISMIGTQVHAEVRNSWRDSGISQVLLSTTATYIPHPPPDLPLERGGIGKTSMKVRKTHKISPTR